MRRKPHLLRSSFIRSLCALCVVASTLCTTPATHADDLLSLYRAGLERDPRYRAAEASMKAVAQRVPQAWAGLLPRAQARAARNRHDERVITDSTVVSDPTGHAGYSRSDYSVSVTQPIVNMPAYAGLRQADAEVRRAEAEFLGARQDLALRVTEAYLQLLLAQDTLVLAGAEKDTLAKHLEAAQAKLRAGVSAISEVEDARARWQIALAQEIDAGNRVDDQRQALREIVGREPPALVRLADPTPALVLDPPTIEKWVEIALTNSPAVIAAEEASVAAREEIARSRAEHYPTIDLVGSRSRTDADRSIAGPGIREDTGVLGFQLTVPLLQGGLVLARTREAAYRHDAALQELEARRRNTERTTRAAFRDMHGTAARVDSLRQAIAASEVALEAKTLGQRAGVYHLLDVLDATRELFRTRRDYAEARYAQLLAFLRLKQAAGVLNDDDIVELNRHFR